MQGTSSKAEAERLLEFAEEFLHKRDLNNARDFAILAQETEPLQEGSDQILAIVDVLSAAQKPVNGSIEWYSILQVDYRCQDLKLVKNNYRRLALLLRPTKNPFTLADHAFKLVSDAWKYLSDPIQKPLYDHQLSQVDSTTQHQEKFPFGMGNSNYNNKNNFWTACPYCYYMYEYPRVYEGFSLRCQNCEKSFHGVAVPSLPPLVPGQEAYYCSLGFFPMGFVFGTPNSDTRGPLPIPNPIEVPNRNPLPPQAQSWPQSQPRLQLLPQSQPQSQPQLQFEPAERVENNGWDFTESTSRVHDSDDVSNWFI